MVGPCLFVGPSTSPLACFSLPLVLHSFIDSMFLLDTTLLLPLTNHCIISKLYWEVITYNLILMSLVVYLKQYWEAVQCIYIHTPQMRKWQLVCSTNQDYFGRNSFFLSKLTNKLQHEVIKSLLYLLI